MKRILIIPLSILIILASCEKKDERLPIYGRKHIENARLEDGKAMADTIYHTIADYSFVDQDSNKVTPATFQNKIYVADFFFTTCPTICPIMKTQMLRVYETFKGVENFMIISHTIDPKHDTVALLRDFSRRLGVDNGQWLFVTGDKDEIYELGETSYMVTASEDPDEPGGYIHSGAFILVDQHRRIRGIYDGTKKEEVNRLMQDIPKLLDELKSETRVE